MANPVRFLTTSALGAAAAYFLDPDQGARRRNLLRDKALKLFRTGSRQAAGAAQAAANQATGAAYRAASTARGGGEAPPSDQALKAKIETELFRGAGAPKGDVAIDVVGGVVTLRGEVKTRDEVSALEAAARAIAGVEDVENLLHTPGEPAKMVDGASAAGRSNPTT